MWSVCKTNAVGGVRGLRSRTASVETCRASVHSGCASARTGWASVVCEAGVLCLSFCYRANTFAVCFFAAGA